MSVYVDLPSEDAATSSSVSFSFMTHLRISALGCMFRLGLQLSVCGDSSIELDNVDDYFLFINSDFVLWLDWESFVDFL
jgi:hypothetical protein